MRPNVGRAIVGGLLGTAALTALLYAIAAPLGAPVGLVRAISHVCHCSWTTAMFFHWGLGVVIFPLIYVGLFRVLRGSPHARGAWWAMILWLLSEIFVAPLAGYGVFNSATGGLTAVVFNFLGHLCYGLLLGWFAGTGVAHEQLHDQEVDIAHRVPPRKAA